MAEVVALVDDVFFQAKLLETARHSGVKVATAATAEAFLSEAALPEVALLVVDLNAHGSAIEALEQLRALGNQRP